MFPLFKKKKKANYWTGYCSVDCCWYEFVECGGGGETRPKRIGCLVAASYMGPDSDSASNPNGGWGGRAQGLFVKAAVLIGGAVLLKRLTKSKTRWDHARIVADSLSGEKVLPSSTSILLSSFQFQLHFFSHFKENYLLNLFILLWPGGWNSFRKNRHREILIISSTSGAFFIFLLICTYLVYALEYWIVFGNKFVFFFLFFFYFIFVWKWMLFLQNAYLPGSWNGWWFEAFISWAS